MQSALRSCQSGPRSANLASGLAQEARSRAGSKWHPDWYLNLLARPDTTALPGDADRPLPRGLRPAAHKVPSEDLSSLYVYSEELGARAGRGRPAGQGTGRPTLRPVR